MVGATSHQQQQAPQLAPPSSSSLTAPTTTPEEDEFLKRNTDCVYFLASPLTCIKGSECEYRHSDIARVNPRDCWYWFNGNCLNPKCAFRHPPLDGLLGPDVSTPMAPPSAPTPHPAPYGAPKQGVACIFFQKGFCLKGHLCPFLHGPPNPVNNKPTQPGSANLVTEPPKMTPPETAQKPVEFKGKQPPLPARNGGGNQRERVVPPVVMDERPPINPNPSINHGYHASENDRFLNGKDADEYSREPSPGFDVLVDNEVEDSEYFHEKDEFIRSRGQGQGQDYDVDRDHHDYDRYNEREGQFVWDDHRESSGRMLVGSAHRERRPYSRSNSPDQLDLRHRISKQRRVSENALDRMPRRDSHHHHDHRHDRRQDQAGLSSRLRGRIKIPGRSMSANNENFSRVEREIDMGRRHQSRYSPGRPLSLNPRVRDRINDDNDAKFAGPKRLSELRSVRKSEVREDGDFMGKRKYPKVEENVSFEGPKPLSEILKRKRGTENRISSVIIENNEKEREIVKEEHNVNGFEAEKQREDVKEEHNVLNDDVNEGGMVDEDALLDEELEAYDHKDGDYEYDQIEGEEDDYNLDEGEFVDEEDGDKELMENNEF